MQENQFRIVVDDGVIRVEGELDLATAGQLDRALADSPGPHLVDLDGVTFMDSSGVNLLMRHYRGQSSTGGSLRVVALSAAARRILDLTQLTDILTGENAAPEARP